MWSTRRTAVIRNGIVAPVKDVAQLGLQPYLLQAPHNACIGKQCVDGLCRLQFVAVVNGRQGYVYVAIVCV